MTSDEAISIMNVIVHMLEPQYDTDRIEDAVEMAIKALEKEPCEDAVSRQAVHEILNDAYFLKIDDGAALQESVNQLPPVTPQPKIGRWERDQFTNQPTCSVCGYKVFGRQTRYCPACGSKN